MSIQQLKIKSSIVDANDYLNGIFSLFNSLNKELFPSSRIIDMFFSHFLFYQANYKYQESKSAHLWKLNDIVIKVLANTNSVIIVFDVSIRNNIVIFITHIHSYSKPIKKAIYYVVNITTTKVELFTIRCGINQVV